MFYAVLTAGVLLFLFFILHFAYKLSDEHMFLRFALLGLIIGSLPLVPASVLLAQNNCQYVVANQTLDSDTLVTSYEYELACQQIEANTPNQFLDFTYLIQRVSFIYLMVYMFIKVLQRFGDQLKDSLRKFGGRSK